MRTISLKLPEAIDAKLETRARDLGKTNRRSRARRWPVSLRNFPRRACPAWTWFAISLASRMGPETWRRTRSTCADTYGEGARLSVADASLVRMAEELTHSAVLTLDGHFKMYRKHRRHVIPLIVPAK